MTYYSSLYIHTEFPNAIVIINKGQKTEEAMNKSFRKKKCNKIRIDCSKLLGNYRNHAASLQNYLTTHRLMWQKRFFLESEDFVVPGVQLIKQNE